MARILRSRQLQAELTFKGSANTRAVFSAAYHWNEEAGVKDPDALKRE
jgi:hypothetical protein